MKQVVETAVFGINDELFGEKVVAVIVIQNSDMEGSSEVDSLKSEKFIEDMKNHLKDRLATYKQPKIFRIMTSIPRNHLGKVNII
jgi:acyl-CoA synthetase (AMP-forming)/AMP-acid ligase II